MEKIYLLLIDDERPVLESLGKILEESFRGEMAVFTAESGIEALETVRDLELQGWLPAVVLSDLMMPGMTGDEVLSQIRQSHAGMKSILLSGRADVSSLGRALNRGGLYRFIAKPWDLPDLLLTLQEALKSYRQGVLLEQYSRSLELKVEEKSRSLEAETQLRALAELGVRSRIKELTLINRCSHRIRRSRSFREIQDSLQQEFQGLHPSSCLSLGIMSSKGIRLEVWGRESQGTQVLLAEIPPLAEAILGQTTLILGRDQDFAGVWSQVLQDQGSTHLAVIPFRTESGLRGCLFLEGNDLERDTQALTLYETLGALTAAASELVQLLNQEREARKAAEQAARVKSRFLANMSHEIRTPMNAILGFTGVLLEAQDIPEAHLDHLKIIHSSGLHLLSVINDILDMSKIEAGRMMLKARPFNLPGALEKVRRLFELQMKSKGLGFYFDLDPRLPGGVLGDESKVLQILINLVSNSLKFTSLGEIRVEAHPGDQGDTLYFSVADTGTGLSPEDQNRMFEPFAVSSETDEGEGGSGLGLAICRHLVESMEGKLTIQSRSGQGTKASFYLKLPFFLGQISSEPGFKPVPGSLEQESIRKRPSDLLTPKALRALPLYWRKNLTAALSQGTKEQVYALIDQLDPEWEPFRRALKDLYEQGDKMKTIIGESL